MSPGGLYEAAGTVFDYRRLDNLAINGDGGRYGDVVESVTEWITSTAPTKEAIQLLVRFFTPNEIWVLGSLQWNFLNKEFREEKTYWSSSS